MFQSEWSGASGSLHSCRTGLCCIALKPPRWTVSLHVSHSQKLQAHFKSIRAASPPPRRRASKLSKWKANNANWPFPHGNFLVYSLQTILCYSDGLIKKKATASKRNQQKRSRIPPQVVWWQRLGENGFASFVSPSESSSDFCLHLIIFPLCRRRVADFLLSRCQTTPVNVLQYLQNVSRCCHGALMFYSSTMDLIHSVATNQQGCLVTMLAGDVTK